MVIECELKELVRTSNFSTIIGGIVDVAADESSLGSDGKLDAMKIGLVLDESFRNTYLSLGEEVGKAWGEGKKYM